MNSFLLSFVGSYERTIQWMNARAIDQLSDRTITPVSEQLFVTYAWFNGA